MKSLFSDNRIANMLQFFRKTPVITVSTLASKLDVSERTVRNDIKQLNHELSGCAVIEGGQGKYSLRIFDADRFREIFAQLIETDDFLNSSRNRMDYIFGKLMRSEEPLLTDEVVVKERFISLLLPHAINITKGKSIDNIRARINDALIKRPRRR